MRPIERKVLGKIKEKGITMDDISKELSISKKTIYRFFKNKNEIVEQVVLRQLDRQAQAFERISTETINAIEKLHEIGKCVRDDQKKVNPSLLNDIRKYYPDVWGEIMDFKDKVIHNTLVSIIKSGTQDGYFRGDINADILATLRQSELEMAMDDKLFPDHEFDIREVHLQLFEHFVHGILTEKGIEEFNKLNNKVLQ